MSANQRTYGGSGRHALPGNGHRVTGSPDDVRKVIRRAHATVEPEPLTFETLDIDPDYQPRHARQAFTGPHRYVFSNGVHIAIVDA